VPRLPGSKNADYDQQRDELLARLRPRLLAPAGVSASFRELAAAADVSPATLRHYFGDRAGVLRAMLAALGKDGLPYLAEVAIAPPGPVDKTLRALLSRVLVGWRFGVGAIHALGLTAGLGDGVVGPAYVQEILEPTLQATEARLARHAADGALVIRDVRVAALELLSPVLLALLHQDGLGGARCRPLDMDAFLDEHLRTFLRAHAPEEKSEKRRRDEAKR